jgi:hypothetical protein
MRSNGELLTELAHRLVARNITTFVCMVMVVMTGGTMSC